MGDECNCQTAHFIPDKSWPPTESNLATLWRMLVLYVPELSRDETDIETSLARRNPSASPRVKVVSDPSMMDTDSSEDENTATAR